MLVDQNGLIGVTLKRCIYCELDSGLALSAAGLAPSRITIRTEGATKSLRTQRKPQVDADNRPSASRAVLAPRPAGEPSESSEARLEPAEAVSTVTDGQAAAPSAIKPPAIEIEDDEIVKRCVAGDRDAFEHLVRRHSPRVFNIIASFFRRRDVVEDIAEAYLDLRETPNELFIETFKRVGVEPFRERVYATR